MCCVCRAEMLFGGGMLCVPFPFHVQCCHIGGLELAVVGIFTPW